MAKSTKETAEEILNKPPQEKKKRGRPKLPRDSEGNIIRENTDKESDKTEDNVEEIKEAKKFEYNSDKAGLFATTVLAATVWSIVGKFINCRNLTDDEASKLGEALDPVLQKYVPIMADWQYEINLITVIGSLYMATKIERTTTNSSAQVEQ